MRSFQCYGILENSGFVSLLNSNNFFAWGRGGGGGRGECVVVLGWSGECGEGTVDSSEGLWWQSNIRGNEW